MFLRRVLLPAFFLLLFPFALLAGEITPELRSLLDSAHPGEELPVIITFTAEADLRPLRTQPKMQRRTGAVQMLRQTAERSQGAARAMLQARGKPFQSLWIINGLALEATPELIETLAARPEVARIEPDGTIELPEVLPSQVGPVEWNIAAVGAPALWELGITGQGVTVAILDSGVDVNHPDLAPPRWRGGANSWFDPYLSTTTPYDPDGHGTLVTGIIVGGNAGGTAIGVAPGAQWIAAKIFRDDRVAVNSQIIASFQWLLDPDGNPATDDAPDVVNNSWGFEQTPGTCDSIFRSAVQGLKAAGIAVVFSGGNGGPNSNTGVSPANYPESFAVGAVDRFSRLAFFSGRGPSSCDGTIYPELVAPGSQIRTSGRTSPGSLSPFEVVDGTSFSAPHVTGVMALLLSDNAFPTLQPGQMEEFLRLAGTDLGQVNPDNDYGFGLVNAVTTFNLLTGNPAMEVHDPIPPENDLHLDFGHLAPGSAAQRTVTVRNAGDGLLQITAIGNVEPPFSLVGQNCITGLSSGQSCSITLGFAPETLESFSDQLTITSTDSTNGPVTLQLAGTGNTPPSPAQLVSPPNGAAALTIPVVLGWNQALDADGDDITHFVFFSKNRNFSDTVPLQVASHGQKNVLLAGAGGLIFFGAAGLFRFRRTWALFLLAAGLALLVACGGGGSSDDPPPAITFTLTDLDPGSTYFWKVVSEDSRGGAVESAVRQFSTQ